VPIFDFLIYPAFAKINLFKRLLQRMAAGLVLVIISFAIAAVLEAQMQSASEAKNLDNQIKLINLSPCELNITLSDSSIFVLQKPAYLKNSAFKIPKEQLDVMFKSSNSSIFDVRPISCVNPSNSAQTINFPSFKVTIENKDLPKSLLIYYDEINSNLAPKQYAYNKNNQVIGKSQIKIAYIGVKNKPDVVKIESSKISYNFTLEDINNPPIIPINYESVDYSTYTLVAQKNTNPVTNLIRHEFELETCGRYTVVMFENPTWNMTTDYVLLTDIYPNGLSLFLQLIQISVLTAGEVMFSISGIF
jgi:hypothetical protein